MFQGFFADCENGFARQKTDLYNFGRKWAKIHRESIHIFPFLFGLFDFSLCHRCENGFSTSPQPTSRFPRRFACRPLPVHFPFASGCSVGRPSGMSQRPPKSRLSYPLHPPNSHTAAPKTNPLFAPKIPKAHPQKRAQKSPIETPKNAKKHL